jgi:signal transduction histidine kinase
MQRSRTIFLVLVLGMVALIVAYTVLKAQLGSYPVLVVFAVASTVFVVPGRMPAIVATFLFGLTAAAVVVVYWLVSTTPLALFLLAALATWREPRRLLALVLAVATGAHLAVQLALGQDTVLTALATVGGVAFIYLIGRLLMSERSQREKVAQLLLDVEQSREAERASYVMAERGRMARDLHDILAHTLSGLAIQLEGARILAAQDSASPALRDAVENAHRLSRMGLQEARRAVSALRGDELPGVEMIPALVEEHRLATGSAARFSTSGMALPVDADANLALYRTAQEALSNVRKHAVGAAVDVTLEWSKDAVVLIISDDGAANSSPAPEAGYGLTGMAERAELLGATLETGPFKGGFRVSLRIQVENGTSDAT